MSTLVRGWNPADPAIVGTSVRGARGRVPHDFDDLEPRDAGEAGDQRDDPVRGTDRPQAERVAQRRDEQEHGEEGGRAHEDPSHRGIAPLAERAPDGQAPRPVDEDQCEVAEHERRERDRAHHVVRAPVRERPQVDREHRAERRHPLEGGDREHAPPEHGLPEATRRLLHDLRIDLLRLEHHRARRVDDEFIDPLVFRSDTILGVPGIYMAYRKGNVAIVNAMGNGIADDKAVYAYVPDMIRYYLNEEPILANVPTYQLGIPENKDMVFRNMENMVIKRTNESGGYGMLIGNCATEQQMEDFKIAINADPRNFIAQPIISLSSAPCYIDGVLQPRRVDLRPFALYGPDGIDIVPGGLTRVALKEGSLVVNSSQGGGSKDTWVLAD